MRGLLPSKGLAQARSMALFSDVLSTAVGFSGAWGSCLRGRGGDRATMRNKRTSLEHFGRGMEQTGGVQVQADESRWTD